MNYGSNGRCHVIYVHHRNNEQDSDDEEEAEASEKGDYNRKHCTMSLNIPVRCSYEIRVMCL